MNGNVRSIRWALQRLRLHKHQIAARSKIRHWTRWMSTTGGPPPPPRFTSYNFRARAQYVRQQLLDIPIKKSQCWKWVWLQIIMVHTHLGARQVKARAGDPDQLQTPKRRLPNMNKANMTAMFHVNIRSLRERFSWTSQSTWFACKESHTAWVITRLRTKRARWIFHKVDLSDQLSSQKSGIFFVGKPLKERDLRRCLKAMARWSERSTISCNVARQSRWSKFDLTYTLDTSSTPPVRSRTTIFND